ncbi:MAG: hypothetical protein IJ915_08445 [Paludibacteraceae bacterium]|nr:hypothetical protein [Paludibacteraceae bacterium]
MAENRDDKIVYATYAIYASANFIYRHGMPGNGRRKKIRGTKVQRTERREKNRHAMMHGGWDGIQSLTMDTRYFTSCP